MSSQGDSLDQDIDGLKFICKGLEMTSERMRRASLVFAWDKYVLQPIRDAKKLEEQKKDAPE